MRKIVAVLMAGATYCYICGKKIPAGTVVCDACSKGDD